MANHGRKILIGSIIETFKKQVDTIAKRLESYLYFSSIRHHPEPVIQFTGLTDRFGCKTQITLDENVSEAMKR